MEQKNKKRREIILNAAANAFYQHGYSATSVDQIIQQVGGSKRTIYNEFKNKEGIFKALIEANVDEFVNGILKEKFEEDNLKENLFKFGFVLMQNFMRAKTVGIFRVILNESIRFPELANMFFENGPKRVSSILEEILLTAQKNSELRDIDCSKSADTFIGMLRSNVHLKILLGLDKSFSKEDITQAVNEAIDIFLNGISKNRVEIK